MVNESMHKSIKIIYMFTITSALCILCFTTPVLAGVFSVTPVRIYMTPKDRAVAVTITNQGDNELTMQADLYLWKQKPDGQNELTLTEDMFLAPPIIKMAPKSRQVVRLARLNPIKSNDQLIYRMILREIPDPKARNDALQLQIALAFSMPVFITPPLAKAKLNCISETVVGDTISITCENVGNAYSHPTLFQLSNSDGQKIAINDTGGYILPGIKRSFSLKREAVSVHAGTATLFITLDDGSTVSHNLTIAN